eukprot:2474349-Amphidinium_carterae.1
MEGQYGVVHVDDSIVLGCLGNPTERQRLSARESGQHCGRNARWDCKQCQVPLTPTDGDTDKGENPNEGNHERFRRAIGQTYSL